MGKRHLHPPHPSPVQPAEDMRGSIWSCHDSSPPGPRGLGEEMAVNTETGHEGILGEGIQAPSVTSIQDLGTELRLL